MYATTAAADVLLDQPFVHYPDFKLVGIGAVDDLDFDKCPGRVLSIRYTDSARTYVEIVVTFLTTETGDMATEVRTTFVVEAFTTLRIDTQE